VGLGEPDRSASKEFDDDFAAADVGVEVRNGGAGVVARDRSETNLTDALTAHRLSMKPRPRFVNNQ